MSHGKILIDTVIFQIQQGRPAGISRVWMALLNEIARSPLAEQVLLLERGAYGPKIPGLRSISIREYNPVFHSAESLYLQNVMNMERGALLATTYYTHAENSPNVLMLHDMTPEIMGFDLSNSEWQAKTQAIEKAAAYLSVSASTRNDFHTIYPQYAARPLFIIPNAVADDFHPHPAAEVERLKRIYNLRKPYFVLCGHRLGYKNAQQFFRAFSLLDNPEQYEILCTGGGKLLEDVFIPYVRRVKTQVRFLSDHELSLAFGGALALVYPSLYEGFGLPILEAMKSGCPVIAGRHSSIPEVAGEAVLYVNGADTQGMKDALLAVQHPQIRAALVDAGFANAARFSWQRSGEALVAAFQTLLSQARDFPLQLTSPLNTGVRLAQSLALKPATHQAANALLEVFRWHYKNSPSTDFAEIEALERALLRAAPAEAKQQIETASRLADSDPHIHYWQGLILDDAGQFDAAFRAYETAYQRGLLTARALQRTAAAALRAGRVVSAARFYEMLAKAVPHFGEARQQWKILQQRQARLGEKMKLTAIQRPAAPPRADEGSLPPGEIAVTVVLPSKDRPDGLDETLASLPAAMGALPYEVLLYLGGAEDEAVNAVAARHGVQRIFRDEQVFAANEKFSWSKIMNHGFRQAAGRWVIYASDDIVFQPLAFVYAVQLAENGGKPWGGVTFLHRNTVEDYGGVFKDYGYDSVGGKTFINFGLINRQAFLHTAGFDEGYQFYWADVDLCLHLWQAGFFIGASPHSLVEHNNIVDKFRVENSGDRYFTDTQYYFDKWQGSTLLGAGDTLAKERFYLRDGAGGKNPAPLPQGEGESAQGSAPLVSAIVSTYNAARFLPGCLDDLEAQTIADRLEIIVVNSGSEQGEERIVREYQRRFHNIVYLATAERESVYAAWNRAIGAARGKYLTNANTDDRHHPAALAQLAAALEANPHAGVAYADCALTQKPNTTLAEGPVSGRFRWPDFDRRKLFQVCFIGPQPMWRKTLHDEYGLFDPTLSSAGDYEFWLRISEAVGFVHLRKVLGLYLEHTASIEHRNPQTAVREAEEARQRHWRSAHGPRPPAGGSFLERYSQRAANQPAAGLPLVSVVVPTFNRPVELRAALQSILEQTYPNLEIIVVNDAGQDAGPVIQALASPRPVRYESHAENRGAGEARNTGMRLARGKYIAFLDDDDRYRPEHLFAAVAELEARPDCAAVYSDGLQVAVEEKGNKTAILEQRVFYSEDFSRAELLARNYIPILCLVFRREALAQAGGFDAALPALEDWEWLTRLAQTGDFVHLPFTTVEYKVRPRARSRNMLTQEQIRALYCRIYAGVGAQVTPAIRQRQRDFYRQMTGRDLDSDLPPAAPRPSAAQTLAALLEADDLPAAIAARRAELTPELSALIRANAQAARADGDADLAEGLEALVEYIDGLVG